MKMDSDSIRHQLNRALTHRDALDALIAGLEAQMEAIDNGGDIEDWQSEGICSATMLTLIPQAESELLKIGEGK